MVVGYPHFRKPPYLIFTYVWPIIMINAGKFQGVDLSQNIRMSPRRQGRCWPYWKPPGGFFREGPGELKTLFFLEKKDGEKKIRGDFLGKTKKNWIRVCFLFVVGCFFVT